MEFSSKEISIKIKEIDDTMLKLRNSFYSNWNDKVHSSFESFVTLCRNKVNCLDDIDSQCTKICHKLNVLKIDEELNKSNICVKKANNVSKDADNLCGGI